jgi:hypothetical protein
LSACDSVPGTHIKGCSLTTLLPFHSHINNTLSTHINDDDNNYLHDYQQHSQRSTTLTIIATFTIVSSLTTSPDSRLTATDNIAFGITLVLEEHS